MNGRRIKPLVALAIALAVAGCSGAEKQRKGGKHTQEAAGNAAVAADPAMPVSVPASYAEFPAEVRMPIYRWDLLNQKCNGNFRSRDESSCSARDTLGEELLAKGWCFGGADEPARMHWVLCAEDYPGGESWIAGPKEDSTEEQ